MRRNLDPLPFDAEIAALPYDEFNELFAEAYRAGDREQFILLGRRLVWSVACGKFRARLVPYRMDMYSVGVLAMLEQFDRLDGRELDPPHAYFRRVVYYQILQFLYRQRLLIRKGAKRGRLLVCDTDITSRDWDGP